MSPSHKMKTEVKLSLQKKTQWLQFLSGGTETKSVADLEESKKGWVEELNTHT